jgi:hypothetical protein
MRVVEFVVPDERWASVHLNSWQVPPSSRSLSAAILEAHRLPAQRLVTWFSRRDRHEAHPHSSLKR